MFKAFFWGNGWKHRTRALLGATVLFLVLIAQVRLAVSFNAWNGTFFDTLSHATERPVSELWAGLWLLGWIALGDMIFGTIAGYGASKYSVWWREALTEHYVPLWKECGTRIEGASQRIQQDPGELAGIVEGIGMDFCRAVITLFAFLPVLWALGRHVRLGAYSWDGTLAAIAFSMSLGGIAISWLVGYFLPKIQYDNEAAEAAFRKQLVFAEEQRSLIEAGHGWQSIFREVIANYNRLFRHLSYFNVWSTSYAKYMMLLPYALCIPSVGNGAMSIALLMQIVHAFGEVQGGFSIIQNNWMRVTKLRSVYQRLHEFEEALEDAPDSPDQQSTVVPLTIRHVRREALTAE